MPFDFYGVVFTEMQMPSSTSMTAMMVRLRRSADLESNHARARVSAAHWPAPPLVDKQ